MDKIYQIKTDLNKECEEICKKGEHELNEMDLKTIKTIIARDNTEPKFIITYLELLRKFKKEEFMKEVEKYQFFLSHQVIQNLGKFYKKELSAFDLFIMLCNNIMNFNDSMTSMEKKCFYKDLTYIEPNCCKVKGLFDFQKNKELTMFLMLQEIKSCIKEYVKGIINYQINEDDLIVKEYRKRIEEIKVFQKVSLYNPLMNNEKPNEDEYDIFHKVATLYKDYNQEKVKEQLSEQIALNSKIGSKFFFWYFNNFSKFLNRIRKNFNLRFGNIANMSDKDFELFLDFCFFLAHFNFASNETNFYVKKWNNTFIQTTEYIEKKIKEKSIKNVKNYRLEKNNLIYEAYYNGALIETKKIKNINNYSIDCIIDYFFIDEDFCSFEKDSSAINEYLIEKYLKFDSYNEIYINKIGKYWEEYLLKIFQSQTIKTAFKVLCETVCINSDYYNFLNDTDLKQLLKRARIFQFKTSFLGITSKYFFLDYECYRGYIESYRENLSKLLNLCINKITKEHEIFGHLNILLQNYISKEKIKLPNINVKDESYNTVEKPESGDFFEMLLYGQSLTQITFNEMLFILDLENYNVDYKQFKANFKKCNVGTYKTSTTLSALLKSVNITIYNDLKKLGFLTLNEDSVTKCSLDRKLMFNHETHTTHFHPPKVSDYIQKIIDEVESKYLNYTKPKY